MKMCQVVDNMQNKFDRQVHGITLVCSWSLSVGFVSVLTSGVACVRICWMPKSCSLALVTAWVGVV